MMRDWDKVERGKGAFASSSKSPPRGSGGVRVADEFEGEGGGDNVPS